MTQAELKTLIRKVQNECSLEEPEKVTYYVNDNGKVVLKLYFDSLKLPKSLRGEDKEHYDWHVNVNNAFTNNEEYLYDDDFEILEYNEEKGYVKVLPDDQGFKKVDSYKDVATDSIDDVSKGGIEKQEESVKLAGKRLNEKVARSYGYLLFEKEDEIVPTEDDKKDEAKEGAEEEEKKDEVHAPVVLLFALTCRFPQFAEGEFKNIANAISNYAKNAGIEKQGLETCKIITVPQKDSFLAVLAPNVARSIVKDIVKTDKAVQGAVIPLVPTQQGITEFQGLAKDLIGQGSVICYLDEAAKVVVGQATSGAYQEYTSMDLPTPSDVISAYNAYISAENGVYKSIVNELQPFWEKFFEHAKKGHFKKAIARIDKDNKKEEKPKEEDSKDKDKNKKEDTSDSKNEPADENEEGESSTDNASEGNNEEK